MQWWLKQEATTSISRSSSLKTIQVIAVVDKALAKYDADHIDVVINEETEQIDIMYCSNNNSYPIESGVAQKDNVDFDLLEKKLDARNVGHVW
ncbi:MAG: hypothetical protein UHN47_05545 [Lachnospiraceae bacterium]|nr:hypothetical protein [Lachnospiraceae bacterium]